MSASRTSATGLEQLENRCLLSASITDRVLNIIGTDGGDTISLTRSGVDDVIANVNGDADTFDMDDFDAVFIGGAGSGDTITNGNGIGNVTLEGGSGNDRLVDGNGSNTLSGVGGNDTLIAGAGDDFLAGGSGTDTVDYSSHSSGLQFRLTSFVTDGPTVTRDGETDRLATFDGEDDDHILDTERFIGTAFIDNFTYQASEGDNSTGFPTITMEGRGGNDTFSNGGTYDRFVAIGGAGDDRFSLGAGINGSAAQTTLLGGDGNDTFDFGNDTGPVEVDGGSGNDQMLFAFFTRKVVDLNDFVGVENARSAADGVLLIGTPGANRLEVTRTGTIQGGDGNDTLIGNGEDGTTLLGEGGDDLLVSGSGPDSLSGGAGRDTVDYSLRTGNLVITQNDSLANDGEVGENDLVSTDVERVLGGSGNDRFVGGATSNTYFGGAGNDTISGVGGADALFGEGGNDLIVGGDGSDFLDGGSGDDQVYGQAGNDTLMGQGGDDRLFAHDNLRDTVNGGSGTDTADVDGLDLVSSVETSA